MVRPGNSMDADPLELNTQAGIINLVTGAFRPNQQEAYCTKVTAFSRNDKGKDIWDSFLDTITCENSSLKGFLQMVVGMSLFGKVYQEGVTFAVGTGKNGKSTFFNTVAAVMGDYAGYIDIDVITTKNSNDKAALATLRGKRLASWRKAAASLRPRSRRSPVQTRSRWRKSISSRRLLSRRIRSACSLTTFPVSDPPMRAHGAASS